MGAAAAQCGCSETTDAKLEDRHTAYVPVVPGEDLVNATTSSSGRSSNGIASSQKKGFPHADQAAVAPSRRGSPHLLDTGGGCLPGHLRDKPLYLEVHIQKTGPAEELGINVKHMGGNLEVIQIHPTGAIPRNNTANLAKQPSGNIVKVGDMIHRVNNVFENDDLMIAECQLKSDLVLQVIRGHEQLARFQEELSKMSELRKATPLRHVGLRTIMDHFGGQDPSFSLSMADMQDSLKTSVKTMGYTLDKDELASLGKVCKVLDVNEDQRVSFYEALVMLPLFCGGGPGENGAALFERIATTGIPHLTLPELRQYLGPMIEWGVKVLQRSPKGMEILTYTITVEIFRDINTGEDQRISLEEWQGWLADHNFYEATKEKLLRRM